MNTKTLLASETPPVNLQKALKNVEFDLFELQNDMKVLSWGCDMLWHTEFGNDGNDKDKELLSTFPIAVLRSLASRTAEFHAAVEQLTKGGSQ